MAQQSPNTVVVGMSGGVDSSVAAALLREQGLNVIGITMKTYDVGETGMGNSTSCCGLDAFNDARIVAVNLGIPHYVVDFTEEFGREVIDNFVEEYFLGRTPNPCVICNQKIKWGALLEKAEALGAGRIATGHYARLGYDAARGRYTLARARDDRKDQTYALWRVSQQSLSRTIFPLGELTKGEVRSMAARLGLKTAAKEESFEICFVADDDYRRFIRESAPERAEALAGGDIVLDGSVVGKHRGFPRYTIGQRSGLGAFGERVYVTGIDAATNTIRIGRPADLLRCSLIASDLNFVSYGELPTGARVSAQVRSRDTATPATVYAEGEGRLRVVFDEPKRAITPGQSVVMYDGDLLIGGGIIQEVLA
jgi:tRNA-specific 2-thiouridylase